MAETIPFNRPRLVGNEHAYIDQAMMHGKLSGNGEFARRCASLLEQRLSAPRVLITPSCTAALEMAGILANLEPGDEVIVPSFTFVSTANAFALRGAVPVFVDSDPETLNIDPDAVAAAVTPRTKALVIVHYGGIACDVDRLLELVEQHNLVLIEDAAHSLPAFWNGRPLGSIGHLSTFSFHETKNVHCGEGGALVINDPALVERAEVIQEKGTDRSRFFRGETDKYTWQDLGSSYLLSEVGAAFLWAQLEQLDEITAERRNTWDRYHDAFTGLEEAEFVRRPVVPQGCEHSGHLYYLLAPTPEARDLLIRRLESNGVKSVFHYMPLHDSPAGQKLGRTGGNIGIAPSISAHLLRLPLWSRMGDDRVDRVIEAVLAHAPRSGSERVRRPCRRIHTPLTGSMSGGRIPVLYIAPWVDLGGSDKGTIDWFKHIDRERWAPSLITTQPSPNRWLHKVEPFAEEVWDLPDLMPGPDFPEFILGFIESREVRVVHIMNSRLGFDLLPDIACLSQPPAIVAQMHAEEPNQAGYVRYATRRYGNLIDAFSVTSEHLKQTLVDYEIPPSRIEVIHSGVDAEEEFNPERVEPLPLDEGVARILWPGRLVEQKDPMLTLEALAIARRRGAEFVLDIVGDGHMKPGLEARAEALGIADAIAWHPPSQEMPRWYRSTDLLLMTSLYEGVPYVIYESLAMGVPVVAPAIPGNLEFMDSDSGLLIEPRDDAEGYAEAIVALLGNRERRLAMGQRARQRMLDEFSLAYMGRHHDRLYERLLGARSASSRWRQEQAEGGAEPDVATAAPSVPLSLPRDPRPKPTVSVGVPCFQHGIFLDQCIRSIKGQTLPPERIVVVDDGSEDPETIAALERWEADAAVTVLRQGANRGPSAARNRALELFDSSYALWIDADDILLPGALDSMVAKLEAAPANVGFIYPHAQHTGNRLDFAEMPAYNLWLLMQENYCPSPALFDRRVFDAASYPEDLVVGHEDWDLILQLAEHGIQGLHADGPTFLYRKQGFSRISAADYGPTDFHEAIARRHPALYGNRGAIKAEWAPALSIVLVDEEGTAWGDGDPPGLDGQTCADFEALTGVSGRGLQVAIRAARGQWVCLLTPATAPMLTNPSFVEKLLRAFTAHDDVVAIALGEAPGITRHTFSQLSDSERLGAQPIGLAFARPAGGSMPKIDLNQGASPLADLVLGLQPNGIVQWRLAKPGDTAADSPTPQRSAAGSSYLDLNYARPGERPEAAVRRALAVEAPLLPRLTPGTVRRWEGAPGWAPPGTVPLCRHLEIGGERRVVTNDRKPPPGYEREFEVGVVQASASPGTQRLIYRAGTFELSNDQDALEEGRGLGYVEVQPLPQHDRLELREMPGSGERVLVAGPYDPLFEIAKPLALLGWIDLFPILPRGSLLFTGPWAAVVLHRTVDLDHGRHGYRVDPPGERSPGTALGSIFGEPGRDLVALRLREDGRLVSDLARPGRTSRDPRKLARWLTGRPAADGGDRYWSPRTRALRLARNRSGRHLGEDEGETLGWLRRQGARESRPLFSTTHPITGDQLVTCDPHAAIGLGYLPDGVLGYILDAGGDHDPGAPPYTVPWASGSGSD